jgi:hypothetical protein
MDIRTDHNFLLKYLKLHQLPMIRTGDAVVTRARSLRVRPTPDEYFVVVNLGVTPVLESKRKIRV